MEEKRSWEYVLLRQWRYKYAYQRSIRGRGPLIAVLALLARALSRR